MNKVFALMFAAVFAFAFIGCGDDEESGPCEEYADKVMDVVDGVCADYPDCSICGADTGDGEDTGEADEEACQEALDAFDADAMTALYEMACQAEAGA